MKKIISRKSIGWLIFLLFFILLIIDRTITLIYFGFVYTDIDQLVMWNGAFDYSNGIFHEPFFYGQPYNYMLEALVAVPLIHLDLPVYKALPIATSLITLLPYVVLGLIFCAKNKYFWACLCLAIPVLLPLEFNFLTTISRGFVQAHLFIPFLFIPLFNPESKKSVTVLFLASAVCFIANQSSTLIIFPIIAYVSTYHIKSPSFYLKSLLVIPVLLLDFFFKYFYKIHPEKILHDISGVSLDGQTFVKSLSTTDLFEYLQPFTSGGGLIYPIIFVILVIVALKKSMKKELIFIISVILIILISFAIPKVQASHPSESAGVFFSISRFYLLLPLLVIISAYLVFKNYVLKTYSIYFLLGICSIVIFIKNSQIQSKVDEITTETGFPIAKNQELLSRAKRLKALSSEFKIDLIVHKLPPTWNFNNLYDSYALLPLIFKDMDQNEELVSVNLYGDRRSWLYEDSEIYERILLIGFKPDEALLKSFEYDIIGDNYILIKNNELKTKTLFKSLNFQFGP